MSFDAGADQLLEQAASADPTFALPHAARAMVHWQQRDRSQAQVQVQVHRAQELSANASQREQEHIAAVVAVVDSGGYIDRNGQQAPNPHAVGRCRDHLRTYPRDAPILFFMTMLTIFSAPRQEQEGLLTLFERLESSYGNDWWFLSWYAFCRHELGDV